MNVGQPAVWFSTSWKLCLATAPELLLLDEPAAGMNPNEINQLMEFIFWIRDEFKLTIILIEHQMRLVVEFVSVKCWFWPRCRSLRKKFKTIPKCWSLPGRRGDE